MLTAQELRGNVMPGLRGSRRVVREGVDEPITPLSVADRERARKWYRDNRDRHLARQAAYDKERRATVTKRAADWRAENPERARRSGRVRAARVANKKRAAIRYMALLIAFAACMRGALIG